GHTALTVENESGIWYYSAGGESTPRRTYDVSDPIYSGGRVVDWSTRQVATPDAHGVIQQYMVNDRDVEAYRLVLPDGVDQKAVESYIVQKIRYYSENYPADCDGAS